MSEKSLEQTIMDKIHAIDPQYKPVPCQLVGTDGNAFAVMGNVKRALEDAGCNQPLIDLYLDLSKMGTYEDLLAVAVIFTEPPEENDEDESSDEWDEDEEDDEDDWDDEEDENEDDEDEED